jgi:Flp pilus assembly protein TadG
MAKQRGAERKEKTGPPSFPAQGRGFLARLLGDARGNTLAIVGAALIPLTAMIGSGVDMSRAYMAKTRLQSACDAAALAGRRVMQNDQLSAEVTAESIRFFNFNFRQGLYGTDTFTPAVTRPTAGTVRVTASTRIPTAIMHMFGFDTLPLDVTCDASLNFVNTDVMLVLDVTGSMDETLAGTKKIVSLRDAVMALYDELRPVQTQLESNGLRLRYGVVPYSSSVNVGTLIRAANPAFLADSHAYQSRVANYTNQTSTSTVNGPYWEYYASAVPYHTASTDSAASISQANCLKFMRNEAFTPFTITPISNHAVAPATLIETAFPHDGTATSGGNNGEWGWTNAPDTSGNDRTCRRKRTDTTTTYRYTYSNDTYRQVVFDTSQYKLGNAVTIATNDSGSTALPGSYSPLQLPTAGTGMATTSATWNGCIEERRTTSTIGSSSGFTIPALASDLDIDGIPDSEETRWRPMWPAVVHTRTAGTTTAGSGTAMTSQDSSYYACPAEARRLQAWNRGQMQSYVNALQPIGGTYHDIGLIWGARMISSGGIFADSPNNFNSMPVNRHVIFMTDGQLAPNCNSYTSYGVEQHDVRVTGSSACSQQYDRHLQRFRMLCNAIHGMNVSVWVIAFGTTMSADMQNCASNPAQASTSANRDQLIAKFREIGNNIGALRLTQ